MDMSLRFIGSLALLVILSGCGESKVPVSGTVRYQDQPLADVNVVMIRTDGKVATATTDSSGSFANVTTETPEDGALPGQYKVGITPVSTISDQPMSGADYDAPTKPRFPVKYLSSETSELTVTVEPGMGPVQLNLTD
jgi:hypothetical protein